MPRTRTPYAGPRTKVRTCSTCREVRPASAFTQSPHQKSCDDCKADPRRRARVRTDAMVHWARARNAAVRRLVKLHAEEYAALLAEERERDQFEGTARERAEFEERVQRALDEGWEPKLSTSP